MREKLLHITKDFTSICSDGKILYLGTPQSNESIYNTLPERGYDVRIWPGRLPTVLEEVNYGEFLAPYIKRMCDANPTLRTGYGLTGNRGIAADPVMVPETKLVKKERDQGTAYFNLQYMLDTKLSDEQKHPLKVNNLIVSYFDRESCPGRFVWTQDARFAIPMVPNSIINKDRICFPISTAEDYFFYDRRIISLDPNGTVQGTRPQAHLDELGLSILYTCNGYIILMYNIGLPGGATEDNLNLISKLTKEYKCQVCIVERNMGAGTFTEVVKSAYLKNKVQCSVEEVWSSGQKEMRIINALEATINTHKLLIDYSVLEQDVLTTQHYPEDKRKLYQLMFQLKHITRDRGALMHEDRLESLSQGVAYLAETLKRDEEQTIVEKQQSLLQQYQKDPFGIWKNSYTCKAVDSSSGMSIMDRFNRRF